LSEVVHGESRLVLALAFAMSYHGDQVREGTKIPYLSHLLGVCALVLEDGGDEDQAVAALLHDVVEDTPASVQDVRATFGNRVAAMVAGCTDSTEEPRRPWRERKERYLRHLSEASPDVLRVSVADKLYNARTILVDRRGVGDAIYDRFTGGKDGVHWYYRQLVDAYDHAPGFESRWIAELRLVVAELTGGRNR
jgi:(p)ppGpp synthase/HD superfamily hydrolase